MARIAMVAILLAAAAAPAAADAVLLSDSRVLQGQVLETTEDGIRMRLENGSEVLVPVEFISPTSYYSYRRSALGDADLTGLLALAEYCLENALLAEAEALGQRVAAGDPGLASQVLSLRERLDEERARLALERAREARARGDFEEALELVKKVLIDHEDSPAAEAAERELDEIVDRLEEERRKAVERRLAAGGAANPPPGPDPAEKPDRKRFERILGTVESLVSRAEEAYRTGLDWDARGVVNKADQAYDESIHAYRLALEGLAHAARRSELPEDAARIAERAAAIQHALVESYLAASYLHSAQRNWREASRYVDGALAIDPAHEYALRLRQRISQEYIRRSAFQHAIGEAHVIPPDNR